MATRRKVTTNGLVKTIENSEVIFRNSNSTWEWKPTREMVYGLIPSDLDKLAYHSYIDDCQEM